MDVFAFRNQHPQHLGLAPWHRVGVLLLVFTFSGLLPALLQSQVQVEGQYLGEVLVEVLAAADLCVLQLVQ